MNLAVTIHRASRSVSTCWGRIVCCAWLVLACSANLSAQQFPSVDGRYFPLNHAMTPGTVAAWYEAGKALPPYFQPVRIELPTKGTVTFFTDQPNRIVQLPAPAQAGLLVTRSYRLKISDMPEFPGVEFFPSVELFDRLHPPAGQAENFPVEVEFLEDEFEHAIAGHLVTKVIYLEQPDRVQTTMLNAQTRLQTLSPAQNLVAEADVLGRPMAIIRLGGRQPDSRRPDPNFFGPGGPIQMSPQPAAKTVVPPQPGNKYIDDPATPQSSRTPLLIRAKTLATRDSRP